MIYTFYILFLLETIENHKNIPAITSQCESKKIKTSPVEAVTPSSRALIKPSRFVVRTSFTMSRFTT